MSAKLAEVLPMSPNAEFGPKVEIIDSLELATRTKLPASWVRAHVQLRCPIEERIPCLRFGKYVRFEWNSPQLNQWLASRRAR